MGIVSLLLTLGVGLPQHSSAYDGKHAEKEHYDLGNNFRNPVARDTLIHRISSQEEYQRFLLELDTPPGLIARFGQSVVKRHLGAMIPILPDTLVEFLHVEDAVEQETWAVLADSAGKELSAWWRSKDPFPATTRNQRLIEHLRRTDYAYRYFARENDEDALDDRGNIYLRFGAPEWREEIHVGYEGEFWVYPSLHDAAEYLLVRNRGRGYMIGQPLDLLPDHSLRGFGPTERGTRKAIRALSTLQSVYGELAHYRSRYGPRYSDLSMYLEQVRQASQGLAAELHHQPHTFAYRGIEEIRTDEAYAQQRRERAVPRVHTTVGRDLPLLPLAVRPVRTLDEEGSTQVDVYWAVRESNVQSSYPAGEATREQGYTAPLNFLLTATAVQETQKYELLNRHVTHNLIRAYNQETNREDRLRTTPVQQTVFTLRSEAARGAFQVDMYEAVVDSESQSVRRRAKIQTGVYRFDDLTLLDSSPAVLEISDVMPVDINGTTSIDEAPVIPHSSIRANEPLGLKFEVYHLTFDEEGQATYDVEYSVERKTDRGWLPTVLRGNEAVQTSVKSTYKAYRKDVTEYIVIDLDAWRENTQQDLRAEVRVRDKNSGQERVRHVTFTLAP